VSARCSPHPLDTTNVLLICGGTFVGLKDIIAKRLDQGGFGFDQLSEICQVAADGFLRYVKPEDLVAFGLVSELLGWLPVLAPQTSWASMIFPNLADAEEFVSPAAQKADPVPRPPF
jgi:ATP-dependent protease Clp ATPase subunit